MIYRFLLVFCYLTFFSFSCKQKSTEEEMDEYCKCKKEHTETDMNFSKCDSLMKLIIEHHEYDPEAVPVIEKKLKECKIKQQGK